MRRWLEEVEGGFALGAREVGDEARESEAADALGAVSLDLFRAGERNAETLDKPFHRIALEDIVGPNPRGGKCAEKRKHLARRVVEPAKKHRLRRNGNAAVDKPRRRLARKMRLFSRVDVDIRPNLAAPNAARDER